MRGSLRLAAVAVAIAMLGTSTRAEALKKGTPDIKSAGALAFGPNGLLFVGDTTSAAIFAIETGDTASQGKGTIKVDDLSEKVAALLGTGADQIMINDLAVNPASGNVYLAISKGRGPSAAPVIARVDRSGSVKVVALENVAFAKTELPAAPAASTTGRTNPRSESITDLAFVDGRVYIAGLSNEQFSSRLLSVPFPFNNDAAGTSIEIYHGAHGQFETKSPVRTFAAYRINGEPYLMAAYTCTPLVKFPVAGLKPGSHFKGTTVAELGNRNKPLDMIVYQKDGKDFILLANSARGVMKVTTEKVADIESITTPVRGGKGTAGLSYETISGLKGVVQLDALDSEHAVIIAQAGDGKMNLDTVALP